MDFTLSPSQLSLQAAAAEAFGRWPPGDGPPPAESWAMLAAEGWLGIALPESAGGAGLGLLEQVLVLEAAGCHLHSGYWPAVVLGALPLARCGLVPAWYPDLAAGRRRVVLALYEQADRFDPLAVTATATAVPEGYRLNGAKVLIPAAATADAILFPARLGNRIALFAVPAGTGVLTPADFPDIARPHANLTLDCAQLPPESLLAPDAETYLRTAVRIAGIGLCAELLGVAEAVLARTTAYAGERHQFGRPIGSFQAIKHRCADMKIALESARSAIYYAAWAADQQTADADLATSVAKVFCSQQMPDLVAHALHIHGGLGFTWEARLHLYFRRTLAAAAYLGDVRWHRERIAQALLAGGAGRGIIDAADAAVAGG